MKSLLKWEPLAAAFVVGAIMLSCSPKTPSTPPETPIEPPTKLTSRVYDNGDVFLRWENDKLSTGYDLKITPADGNTGDMSRTVGTYYVNISKSELEYSTSYNWTVRTLVDDKSSEWAAAGTFTTRDRPDTEVFMGNWQVAPENVDVIAGIAGNNVELPQLMPGNPGYGEAMTFVISEATDEDGNVLDNQVTVNMADISGYIPVGGFEELPLSVKPDRTLTGWSGASDPVKYEFEEPLPLSEIPGLSDYLDGLDELEGFEGWGGITVPDLSTVEITSFEIKVNSISVTANFPDPEDTSKLRFNVVASANFGITTVDGTLEDMMGFLSLLYDDISKLTIMATIDSEKSIE